MYKSMRSIGDTEEIINEKLHILCSASQSFLLCNIEKEGGKISNKFLLVFVSKYIVLEYSYHMHSNVNT